MRTVSGASGPCSFECRVKKFGLFLESKTISEEFPAETICDRICFGDITLVTVPGINRDGEIRKEETRQEAAEAWVWAEKGCFIGIDYSRNLFPAPRSPFQEHAVA